MYSNKNVWVVILAAGEGKRVRNLTNDRHGNRAPKQYSSLDGTMTLIGATLERAKKISPPERIVPIVAAQHKRWWSLELSEIPSENVVVQPENRGTAAGILLPLLWITSHDPDATVVVLPSDHGIAAEDTLHSAIMNAIGCADDSKPGIVLLGVTPEGPETDYGWIVPCPGGCGCLLPVATFREKPDPTLADSLFSDGALLNSFILVTDASFLLDLFETVVPDLWKSFQPVVSNGRDRPWKEQDVAHLYRSIPVLDFSKDLLEQSAEKLWVYPVPACGWLDLGTPERLTRHLISQGQPPCCGRAQAASNSSVRGHRVFEERSGPFEVTEPAAGATTHPAV